MRRVRHQIVPAEMALEDLPAGLDRLFLGHAREAGSLPGLLAAFHDEGRGVRVELVDMRPYPAMLRLLEDEGEGVVEFLVRAEPDELAEADVDIRLENLGIFVAHHRVDAIASDHQIIFAAIFLRRSELRLEAQFDAEFARPLLQQDEHLLAADARETMPAGYRAMPIMHHRDIVPIGEMIANGLGALGVVLLHARERVIRENHAPAEGIVGAVALQHDDLMRGVAQLHRDREIEAGRASTEAENAHVRLPETKRIRPRFCSSFKFEISSLKICCAEPLRSCRASRNHALGENRG